MHQIQPTSSSLVIKAVHAVTLPHPLLLVRKTEPGRAGALVEDDVLRLEEDITVDGEADLRVALDASKALLTGRVHRSVVDVAARNDGIVAADSEGEVGEGGAAVEDIASLLGIVGGAGDLLVVGVDDRVIDEHERGARIGDTGAGRHGSARADGGAVGREGPEALAVVHCRVRYVGVGVGAVQRSKVVAAGLAGLEVGGEGGGKSLGDGVVEEGLLLGGSDGVDTAEGKAEESVGGARGECRGDGGGRLDRLLSDGRATDRNGVGIDVSASRASVAVGDLPGLALKLGGAAAWLVGRVRTTSRGTTTKDPEIGRASVEVELESLAGDLDGRKVLRVVLLGSGGHVAGCGAEDLGDLLWAGAILGKSLCIGGWAVASELRVVDLVDLVVVFLFQGSGGGETGEGRSHSDLLEGRHCLLFGWKEWIAQVNE